MRKIMSSEIHTDFQLYSIDATHPLAINVIESETPSYDLFSEHDKTLYVLICEHHSSNTYPVSTMKDIAFIGTHGQFEAYSEFLQYSIDDGIDKISIQGIASSSSGWRKLCKSMFKNVKPITVDDLSKNGIFAFSYSMETVNKHQKLAEVMYAKEELVQLDQGVRAVRRLGCMEDVQSMVAACVFVTSQYDEKRFTFTPWIMSSLSFSIKKWVSQSTASKTQKAA